jgi:hypothetical protein
MPVISGTLAQMMADPSMDASLTLTAQTLGLPKETVIKIVRSALPVMAKTADANPVLFRALFAQSRQTMHQPAAAFSTKPAVQQAAVAAFRTLYGPTTDALRLDAATQAGATEEQTGKVLAAVLPVLTRALGVANTGMNEVGFGRQLRRLHA